MRKLGKKTSKVYNSIEAYACACVAAGCSCSCSCGCYNCGNQTAASAELTNLQNSNNSSNARGLMYQSSTTNSR